MDSITLKKKQQELSNLNQTIHNMKPTIATVIKETQALQRSVDQIRMKSNIKNSKILKKIKDVESTCQLSADE